MPSAADAEENLQLIRHLMERATVYRAISAPSALVAGLLSTAAAGAVYYNDQVHPLIGRALRAREFAFIWLGVLVLTGAANAFFRHREARASGGPFFSSAMKVALGAIAPNLLIPAAFTIWFLQTGYLGAHELELVVVWVAFYGLALLSTSLFAPRSLVILGWAFLLTALAVPLAADPIDELTDDVPGTVMGVTFGLYHLIYAAATWLQRRPVGNLRAAE